MKRHSALLDTREVADHLGLTPGCVQNWRIRGEGPVFVRLGRAVRYTEADLERFIEAGKASRLPSTTPAIGDRAEDLQCCSDK